MGSRSAETCTLKCDGINQCKNTRLKCRDNNLCHIKCNDENACNPSTIIDCANTKCTIFCESLSSCNNMEIHSSQSINVECIGYCDFVSTSKFIKTTDIILIGFAILIIGIIGIICLVHSKFCKSKHQKVSIESTAKYGSLRRAELDSFDAEDIDAYNMSMSSLEVHTLSSDISELSLNKQSDNDIDGSIYNTHSLPIW